MDWPKEHLGRIAELVDLLGSEDAARAFLEHAGVRVVDGIFSRDALLRALDPSPQVDSASDASDDIRVLRKSLAELGLEVNDIKTGRTTSANVVAIGSPRLVVTYDRDDVPDMRIAPKRSEGAVVRARIYATAKRHAGVPQFTVTGFGDDEPATRRPDLFFFVLTPESRVWMATRDDLAAVDAELRERARGQRGRRRFGSPGFAPIMKKPGYLRIWMPEGHDTGLDPAARVTDENRHFVAATRRTTA